MKYNFFNCEFGNIHYGFSKLVEAPLVVFIHGVGMDLETFHDQVDALRDKYSLLVWDLPGHGQSTIRNYNQRFTTLSADCLFGLMKEIGENKAVLLGQSLGSLVVQHFLSKYPSMVSATIHVPGIELKSHVGKWVKRFVPLMMGIFYILPDKTFYKEFGKHRSQRLEVQQYLSRTMHKTGKKLALRITQDMIFDLIDGIIVSEKRPMLILYGEKDLFFLRRGSKNWHNNVDNSECIKIPEANHIANQDNPGFFNKAILTFLDSNLHKG